MAYIPPVSPITLDFTGVGYLIPTGGLSFELNPDAPQSLYDVGAGGTSVFGTPTAYLENQFVYSAGFDSAVFGEQFTVAPDQFVTPLGLSTELFGEVLLGYPRDLPINGFDSSAFGDSKALHPLRFIFLTPFSPASPPIILDFYEAVGLKNVYQQGFSTSLFGSAQVYNLTQIITVNGFSDLAFGDIIPNVQQNIFAFGIADFSSGPTTIYNRVQAITDTGHDLSDIGAAIVYNKLSYVYVNGFNAFLTNDGTEVNTHFNTIEPTSINEGGIGTPSVGFDIQYLHVVTFDPTSFGVSTVTLKNQHITVPTFGGASFGVQFVATGVQSVLVGSISDGYFPPPLVRDPTQWMSVDGLDHSKSGLPIVTNRNIALSIGSTFAFEAGEPWVYNKNQFVYQATDFRLYPEEIIGPEVSNHNKTLYADGIDSLRMKPYHTVFLEDIALPLSGFETSEFGNVDVSNQVRYLTVAGVNGFSGIVAVVSNVADDLRPNGWNGEIFGDADVFIGDQLVYPALFENESFGIGFIADAVRYLTTVESISNFSTGGHWVSESPQRVSPDGVDSSILGMTKVILYQGKIEPFSIYNAPPPAPTIFNRNRYLTALPIYPEEFGNTKVYRSIEGYNVQGFETSVFGLHRVEDRLHYVRPQGVVNAGPSANAILVKVPPDPPGIQTIYPIGWSNGEIIGIPALNHNVIYVEQDEQFAAFGTPKIASGVIFCTGIFEDFIADTRPTIPWLQIIAPQGMETAQYAKHSSSPLTIWATTDTPQQAIDNHPGDVFYPIDTLDEIEFFVGIGAHFISNKHRQLPLIGLLETTFGTAVVSQQKNYIYPEPIKSLRFGAVKIPNPGEVNVIGFASEEFGIPDVGFYVAPNVNQTIKPIGITGNVGDIWVSNFNREIYPTGFIASAFGTQWVSRELDPIPISLGVTTQFGTAYVDYRNRYFNIQGTETLEIGESFGEFQKRMRVFGRAKLLSVSAGQQTSFGHPWVSNSSQTILADPIADWIVVAPHFQHKAATVGFESSMVGTVTVQTVEEGIVKAHSLWPDSYGKPSVIAVIRAPSIVGDIGNIRIGQPMTISGIHSNLFGDHTLTGDGDHTCGMAARGIVVQGIDSQMFGQASA